MKVEIRLTMAELADLLQGVEVGSEHVFETPGRDSEILKARIDGEVVVIEWDD